MAKALTDQQKAKRERDRARLQAALDRRGRLPWGSLRVLPSGRVQARYRADVNGLSQRFTLPTTYDTLGDAEAALAAVRADIQAGRWVSPDEATRQRERESLTFGEYAERWLTHRDLKPRTKAHYRSLLDRHVRPILGPARLVDVTPADVRAWHQSLDASKATLRAHAYSLVRAIFTTAYSDDLVPANPCRIRGASSTKRRPKWEPLTRDQLAALVAAMPDRHQALVLLAAWCGLRYGELTELRRGDVELVTEDGSVVAGVLRVRRAVTRVTEDGVTRAVVGTPKSDAGIRDVTIPPHVLPAVVSHLAEHVAPEATALLFPAADGTSHLAPSAFYGKAPTKTRAGHGFYRARIEAGVPELREHDLRHMGSVLAAQAGASLAELMGRLGHSTTAAAQVYMHAAAERDAEIAKRMSEMA